MKKFKATNMPKRILSIVLSVMIIAGTLYIPAAITNAAAGDAWDLNNFIKSVVITDKSGNPITDGKVYYGETYTFSITFTEVGKGALVYDTGHLKYELPKQIEVKSPINGEIHAKNGTTIGWYTIDTNGRIEVWFGNFDIDGNQIGENFIDFYTDATFMLDIDAEFKQGNQTGTILFGTGAEITINIEYPEAEKPKIGVEKKVLGYANETVNYEVVIKAPLTNANAVPATVTDITLTDKVTNLTSLPQDMYTNIKYVVNRASPTDIIDITNTDMVVRNPNGNGLDCTFPGLVLNPGDTITVTYALDLQKLVAANTTTGRNSLQYDFNVNNTATVRGKAGDNELTANDNKSVQVTKKFVWKTYVKKDGTIDKATATATVGDGSTALVAGQKITDTLSSNPTTPDTASFPTVDKIKIILYSEGLVKIGEFTAAELSAYFAFIGNDKFTFTVPAEGIDIPTNAGNVTGKFPKIYRVAFEYETTYVDETHISSTTVTYTNKIEYEGASESKSFDIKRVAKRPGIGDNDVTKTSSKIYQKEPGKYAIDYTITVKVPEGNKDKYFYICDMLYLANSPGTTYLVNNPNLTITIYPETSDFASCYSVTKSNQNWYLYFYYSNNKPTTSSSANSVWPYSTEKTITITYTIMLDEIKNTANTSTLEALFKANTNSYLNNTVYIRDINTENITYKTVYDAWPIYKTAKVSNTDSSVFDYTVLLNCNSSGNGRYQLFSTGDAIFTDTFDPELEYVEKSFYIRDLNTANNPNRYYGPYTPNGTNTVGSVNTLTNNNAIIVNDGSIEIYFNKLSQLTWNNTLNTLSAATVNANVTTTNWYTQAATRFEIHYQLRVKDSYVQEGQDISDLENTATFTPTEPSIKDRYFSSKATVKFEYARGMLTKSMKLVTGTNTADVDIRINPEGRKIVPAGSNPSDQFTAVDTMSDNLTYYLNSIKIYTMFGGVPQEQTISGVPNSLWSIQSTGANSFAIILPDETPVKITYTALITAPIGTKPVITNKIEVFGYSDEYIENKYVVQNTTGTASGSKQSISLTKHDNDDNIPLEDAEFDLYMAIPSNGYYGVGIPTDKLTIGGKDFYKVQTKTTNANGIAIFDSSWLTPSHEAIYLLVEKNAPDGYIFPAEPDNYTFFTLHSLSENERNTLKTAFGKEVIYIADNVAVDNTARTAEIKLQKSVNAGDLPPDDEFTFNIEQVNDENGTEYTGADKYNVSVKSKAGSFIHTIKKLDEGKTYYKITENRSGNGNVWVFDPIEYIIKVVVPLDKDNPKLDKATVTVVSPDNYGSDTLVFTNTYIPKTELKLTKEVIGGNDTTLFPFTVVFTYDGADAEDVLGFIEATASTLTVEQIDTTKWTATWTGTLAHGEEVTFKDIAKGVTYEIKEDEVSGYEMIPNTSMSGTVESIAPITVTVENMPLIDINVKKVWSGDEASVRPPSVQIQLWQARQGENPEEKGTPLTLDGSGTTPWSGKFTNLHKYYYDNDNKEYREFVYSVTEENLVNYNPNIDGDAATGFTITNTYIPPPTGSVTVKKLFATPEAEPTSGTTRFTVVLTDKADSTKTYTFTLIGSSTPPWSATKAIPLGEYEVTETDIPIGYEQVLSLSDNEITVDAGTNSDVTVTVTNRKTVGSVTVKKLFSTPADEPKDGTEFTVVLTDKTDSTKTYTFTLIGSSTPPWSATKAIPLGEYGVTETNIPAEYEKVSLSAAEITVDAGTNNNVTVTVTNKQKVIIPPTTSVTVTKIWNDNNAPAGLRPSSVTINLLQDGIKINSVTLSSPWTHTFDSLPVGHAYIVEEEAIAEYQSSVTGTDATGFTVTNTYNAPATTSVTVEKVWIDDNAPSGLIHPDVTINLLQDGNVIGSVILSDPWIHTFDNLPAGSVYTIEEVPMPGYKTIITGDAATGFTVTNTYKTADIIIDKVIRGISSTRQIFNFTLTELNSDKTTEKANGFRDTISITGAGSNTFKIPGLTEGEYYYRINEESNGTLNWTYDTTPRIVTVTVDGNMNVSMDLSAGSLTFTNTYTTPSIIPETPPDSTPGSTPTPTTTAAPTTTATPTTTPGPSEEGEEEATPESTPESTPIPTPGPSEEDVIEEEEEEPPKEPTIDEPATEAPTTPPSESPTETPTSGTVALPEDVALAEFENLEDLIDNATPLSNGWFAVDLGGDIWEIFDENGVPLGIFYLPEGANIGDLDIDFITSNLLPLGNMIMNEETSETAATPPRKNPQTGDNIWVILGLMIVVIGGGIAIFTVAKKKTNGYEI